MFSAVCGYIENPIIDVVSMFSLTKNINLEFILRLTINEVFS